MRAQLRRPHLARFLLFLRGALHLLCPSRLTKRFDLRFRYVLVVSADHSKHRRRGILAPRHGAELSRRFLPGPAVRRKRQNLRGPARTSTAATESPFHRRARSIECLALYEGGEALSECGD